MRVICVQVLATPFGQAIAPMLTGMEARLNTPMAQQVLTMCCICFIPSAPCTSVCLGCASVQAWQWTHHAARLDNACSMDSNALKLCCSMLSHGHIRSPSSSWMWSLRLHLRQLPALQG
jgi:hypothetical protein